MVSRREFVVLRDPLHSWVAYARAAILNVRAVGRQSYMRMTANQCPLPGVLRSSVRP